MANSSFNVVNPGIHSTLQDLGRFQHANLGITTGGPADKHAFYWANRLVQNNENTATIELSHGGLDLVSTTYTTIAITGADTPLKINGVAKDSWQSHHVQPDDEISIGFANKGCRIYLAVAGGFQVNPQFGSISTVIREKLGGINGNAISAGVQLPVIANQKRQLYRLAKEHIPLYSNALSLRVITGYQASQFNKIQLNKFFSSQYKVSAQNDRMGYRLTGPSINSNQSTLYSEGICLGAVQIPPDGQPIVLSVDRQTIGGYPKIGSVLSLDLYRLMQCTQQATITFNPISIELAHNLLQLDKLKSDNTSLITITS